MRMFIHRWRYTERNLILILITSSLVNILITAAYVSNYAMRKAIPKLVFVD